MTKRKLAEQVLRLIKPSLSEDYKVDIREAMLAVGQIRDNMILFSYFDDYKLGNKTVRGDFLSRLVKTVEKVDGEIFCEVTEKFVNLPKNRGLFSVLYEDASRQFALYPMTQNARAISEGTDTEHLDRKSYLHETGRIVLFNSDLIGKNLVIYGVLDSESIDEDADYPVPSGRINEIVKSSAEMLLLNLQIPEDKINNNLSE